MRISEFIDQSNLADSIESILALMERAAGDLGFDKFAYYALTRYDDYDAGLNPAPLVAHNYSTSWIDYYFKHDFQTRDPVVLLAPEIERPFLWDTLSGSYNLNRKQIAFMRKAREAGLKDGVGVPLHGPRGDVCLVTFASAEGHSDPGVELPKLDVLATQFHSAYSAIGRSEREDRAADTLSVRERECLQWIARGKSSWDISMILRISENTVNFHVKNARSKLDANTRIMAVVKAIRYGLISL